MLTTIYVALSLLHYFLDDYPTYKHLRNQADLYGDKISRFDKIMFYATTANAVLSVIILLLKCIGIIEWW